MPENPERAFGRFEFIYSAYNDAELYNLAKEDEERRIGRDELYLKVLVRNLAEIKNGNQAFFERYDYAWALNPDSYRSSLEVYAQAIILRACCALYSQIDIEKNPPVLRRLDGLVARVVNTGTPSAESSSRGGFRYIVLSRQLYQLFEDFSVYSNTAASARPLENQNSLQYPTSNIFGAKNLVNGMIPLDLEIRAALEKATSRISAMTQYSSHPRPPHTIQSEADSERYKKYFHENALVKIFGQNSTPIDASTFHFYLPDIAISFVLLHELCHFLFGHAEQTNSRSDQEESLTDTFAIDLMERMNKTFDTSGELGWTLIWGSAFALSVLRLFHKFSFDLTGANSSENPFSRAFDRGPNDRHFLFRMHQVETFFRIKSISNSESRPFIEALEEIDAFCLSLLHYSRDQDALMAAFFADLTTNSMPTFVGFKHPDGPIWPFG